MHQTQPSWFCDGESWWRLSATRPKQSEKSSVTSLLQVPALPEIVNSREIGHEFARFGPTCAEARTTVRVVGREGHMSLQLLSCLKNDLVRRCRCRRRFSTFPTTSSLSTTTTSRSPTTSIKLINSHESTLHKPNPSPQSKQPEPLAKMGAIVSCVSSEYIFFNRILVLSHTPSCSVSQPMLDILMLDIAPHCIFPIKSSSCGFCLQPTSNSRAKHTLSFPFCLLLLPNFLSRATNDLCGT